MNIPAILRGTSLVVAGPTFTLLAVIGGEKLGLPEGVQWVFIAVVFFLGFGILIRTQFARRQKNSDVAVSFLAAEALGLALLGAVVFLVLR
jgi:hypothetical protein